MAHDAPDDKAPTPWIIVCGEGIKVTVQISDGLPDRDGNELREAAAHLLLVGVWPPTKMAAVFGKE